MSGKCPRDRCCRAAPVRCDAASCKVRSDHLVRANCETECVLQSPLAEAIRGVVAAWCGLGHLKLSESAQLGSQQQQEVWIVMQIPLCKARWVLDQPM